MSTYLCVYLKDVNQEKYVTFDSYNGYIRDAFYTELGHHTEYDKDRNPLATLVSKEDIESIIKSIEKDIQRSLDNIENTKKHINLISQMTDKSISDRLEAIQVEENYITECKDDIDTYQYVKNFYTVLLDLNYDGDRIYAGIDCFAPDGSDIEK